MIACSFTAGCLQRHARMEDTTKGPWKTTVKQDLTLLRARRNRGTVPATSEVTMVAIFDNGWAHIQTTENGRRIVVPEWVPDKEGPETKPVASTATPANKIITPLAGSVFPIAGEGVPPWALLSLGL